MEAKFTLKGFDEIKKLLDQLPDRVENRVLQASTMAGMRAGAKIIRAAAPRGTTAEQSPASKKYGPLRKNVRIIRLRRVRRGEKGARIDTGNGFWWRFLEFGTRYIPARPSFAPAFRAAQDVIIAAVANSMLNRIEKEAVKLGKETGSLR